MRQLPWPSAKLDRSSLLPANHFRKMLMASGIESKLTISNYRSSIRIFWQPVWNGLPRGWACCRQILTNNHSMLLKRRIWVKPVLWLLQVRSRTNGWAFDKIFSCYLGPKTLNRKVLAGAANFERLARRKFSVTSMDSLINLDDNKISEFRHQFDPHNYYKNDKLFQDSSWCD